MFAYLNLKLTKFIEALTNISFANIINCKHLPFGIIGLFLISISWLISNSTLRLIVMFIGFLTTVYPDVIKYKCMALLIGYSFWFIKSIKPVEYINYSSESKYGIARFKNSKWILSIYNDDLILDDDGIIREPTSIYYFWLPLQYGERIQHVLSTNLPDFKSLLMITDAHERAMKINYEYRKRTNE